ncbi:MBL fold metallo-hydrolase [Halomicroarcula sp. S1AR25-4]|uniref:MBL fold metallo-hydrolase n=1 Tax=Haloarcula sp. S1AR25-4 TaxID=2950538 RepID=UPI0028761DDB|nr:MBL fold metallo-hydrolase [Halomicroarcula sp. S1AR25-4]MDS0276394.1 MBL fold metallo-hydrolase [Halomicroarcula sp. S1AR25-4]
MVRRLSEGVWLLELGLFPPLASNAYLVDESAFDGESDALTLVDTGLWWNEPTIVDELAAVGYGPADLDRVLLTHYDLDHVGGLNRLVPEFDGPVSVGTDDLALLEGHVDPELLHHKGLFHRASRRLFPLPDLVLEPVADGDAIGGFTAYHTPGHNPGHVVYHHADASAAFLGDLVWEDDGDLTTPFWGDSYDMNRLRRSIADLSARIPPFEIAAMGHGDPLTVGGDDALRTLASRV